MGRTAKTAANKLPERAREPFLRAWEAANSMDLYEGHLERYLDVIAQVLERKTKRLDKVKDIIAEINKAIKT